MTSKTNLRYGEVLDLLEAHDISRSDGRIMIEQGIIRGGNPRGGNARKYYPRAPILQMLSDLEGPSRESRNCNVESRK